MCTHGHSDHVGNLSMFDKAVHILSYDVCEGDKYHMHDFKKVCFLLDLAKYAGSFLIIYKIIT